MEFCVDNWLNDLRDRVEGRRIAVTWSGGFDSTLVAIICKELGAEEVVCECNISDSVNKLGDAMNRKVMRPVFENLGIAIQEINKSIYSTEGMSYHQSFLEQKEKLLKGFDKVAIGFRGQDAYSILLPHVFGKDAFIPLISLPHHHFQAVCLHYYNKYPVLRHLSSCDRGHNFENYDACSVAKDRSGWCHKCHNDMGGNSLTDWTALKPTLEDLYQFTPATYRVRKPHLDLYGGSFLGYNIYSSNRRLITFAYPGHGQLWDRYLGNATVKFKIDINTGAGHVGTFAFYLEAREVQDRYFFGDEWTTHEEHLRNPDLREVLNRLLQKNDIPFEITPLDNIKVDWSTSK